MLKLYNINPDAVCAFQHQVSFSLFSCPENKTANLAHLCWWSSPTLISSLVVTIECLYSKLRFFLTLSSCWYNFLTLRSMLGMMLRESRCIMCSSSCLAVRKALSVANIVTTVWEEVIEEQEKKGCDHCWDFKGILAKERHLKNA